jgi:hypothetical protein
MKMIDIYLIEMNNANLKKISKGDNISKIIDAYTDANDDQKDMIMSLVDKNIKKQLSKMIDGGLL